MEVTYIGPSGGDPDPRRFFEPGDLILSRDDDIGRIIRYAVANPLFTRSEILADACLNGSAGRFDNALPGSRDLLMTRRCQLICLPPLIGNSEWFYELTNNVDRIIEYAIWTIGYNARRQQTELDMLSTTLRLTADPDMRRELKPLIDSVQTSIDVAEVIVARLRSG